MAHKLYILILLLCLTSFVTAARSREAVKTSTDILMFAAPAAGLVTSLAIGDYEGTKQLAFGAATSVAASYLLKYCVKKRRPDHSDYHSFPSNHSAVAFQGASFIQRRYGWKYGIPAYLISGYVAWGRVYARRHDCWDVLAGAAIGIVSSYIFTHPFARKHNLSISPVITNNGRFGLHASMTF